MIPIYIAIVFDKPICTEVAITDLVCSNTQQHNKAKLRAKFVTVFSVVY